MAHISDVKFHMKRKRV